MSDIGRAEVSSKDNATKSSQARFGVNFGETSHNRASESLREGQTCARRYFALAFVLAKFNAAVSSAWRISGNRSRRNWIISWRYRRTYSRPKPPEKAISTIHKAKGLECNGVIVMPCDATTFPNKLDARCLFYVAISRAKSRLLLVESRNSPSPLLQI